MLLAWREDLGKDGEFTFRIQPIFILVNRNIERKANTMEGGKQELWRARKRKTNTHKQAQNNNLLWHLTLSDPRVAEIRLKRI